MGGRKVIYFISPPLQFFQPRRPEVIVRLKHDIIVALVACYTMLYRSISEFFGYIPTAVTSPHILLYPFCSQIGMPIKSVLL